MPKKTEYKSINVLSAAATAFQRFCRKEGLKIYIAAADALRIYMQVYKDDKRN